MAFKDDEERRAFMREYNKGWYQRHRERLRVKRKLHDEELKEWLKQYKNQLICKECGEDHPACLQFHHRDREEKKFNISAMLNGWRYFTIKKLQAEIAKCDVLCANCHAIHHWREIHDFDDWRDVFPGLESE